MARKTSIGFLPHFAATSGIRYSRLIMSCIRPRSKNAKARRHSESPWRNYALAIAVERLHARLARVPSAWRINLVNLVFANQLRIAGRGMRISHHHRAGRVRSNPRQQRLTESFSSTIVLRANLYGCWCAGKTGS